MSLVDKGRLNLEWSVGADRLRPVNTLRDLSDSKRHRGFATVDRISN